MTQLQKRMQPLLGCFVEIALPETPVTAAAFNAAFTRISLIQQLLSFHDLGSDLSRLNAAQGSTVNCHPLSIQCLRLAKAITRASTGRFNCTLGAAVIGCGVLPAHDYEARYGERLLSCGDWYDIELTAKTARLRRPILITLDGIAKGFAVDSAIAELKRLGIHSGWINAGGDIRVFGDIVLPVSLRSDDGEHQLLGGLQNAAIATSTSVATRDFPGVLLDQRGQSIRPMTASVIARSAWRADALTKVAATLNAQDRDNVLAQLGGRWAAL